MDEQPKAWAIRAAEKERANGFARLFWDKGIAALDYLGNSGPDIRECDLARLKDVVRDAKEDEGLSTHGSAVGRVVKQLQRFAYEIGKGDWILTPRPKPGDVMIGHCITTYEYAPGKLDKDKYPYVIRVDWIRDLPRSFLSEELQHSIEGRNGLSLWPIDAMHIPELESLCKLSLEYRNVPVNLPGYLVQAVDELVGERGRSHFIVDVVLKELGKTENTRKEKEKSGEEFHPNWETPAMVYAWVRASRDSDNARTEEKLRDRLSS